MKKIFLIALFSLFAFATVPVLADGNGYPPIKINVCNHEVAVVNPTVYTIPFTLVDQVGGYVYNQPLTAGMVVTFTIPAGHTLVISSGVLSLQVNDSTGCFNAYDGTLMTGYPVYVYPTPVYQAPVVYINFTPESCVAGTYQGILPLVPTVNGLSGNVVIYQTDGPDSGVLRTQSIFDAVLNNGKFDALTRCTFRQTTTVWQGPNYVLYPISNWYRAYVDGVPVVTFGLLSGQTNQALIVWYDATHFAPDQLHHYVFAS
ncbi:hypothetical protein KBA63_01110 [Candidatus Woesebacteria bacterium]|jgi:hypothetical protein|nr:hypothetical protein [Candidatus Woesebacteria bacterium]MBP9687443.1 hypothetical protein [Candidatus Woesebacteria bacterium]